MTGLNPDDFQFVTAYLRTQAGISLSGDKSYLVENRLAELCRTGGYANIAQLVASVKGERHSRAGRELVEAMTTNETSFFRDLSPFEGLRQTVLPDLFERRQASRKLSVWSAACATGQEPYSLAMTIDSMGAQGWDVRVLGTDLAEKVLRRAEEGRFSDLEVGRGLPPAQLARYFRKSGKHWEITEALRRMVRFEQLNLLAIPEGLGRFDLIFCRNVLIYFDLDTKRHVLHELSRKLAPDGYLFMGASEVLNGVTDCFTRVSCGGAVCYRPKDWAEKRAS